MTSALLRRLHRPVGRSFRHITRSLDTIITTTIMPIGFMLLFVYVFGGAIRSGSGSYVDYLLPGILIITIASGISYTAFRLFLDLKSGIFERFQSMPIARSSVLWAHVLTSLVANLISLVVVVLVALLMGFRSGAGVLAWLAVAGILIAVHPGVDVDRRDPRSLREVRGRRERVRLSAHLPAVHQLGIRAHQHHARPGARLRRAPAGDVHRQHDPRPVHSSSRSAPTSGSPLPGVSASSSSRTASPWSSTAARSRRTASREAGRGGRGRTSPTRGRLALDFYHLVI